MKRSRPRSSSSPLPAPYAATALFAGFLAWRIFCFGAADTLAHSDPRAALSWNPAHPTAQALAAQQELASKDAAHARAAARTAEALILRDPLAPGGLTSLGVAVARSGDLARAEKILRVAAAHQPLDLVAHSWLYEQALKTGDNLAALSELDILLRARPFMAERMGGVASRLIGADAEAEGRFAELLASQPPWRALLLDRLNEELVDVGALMRLYDRLQKSPAPPSAAELRSFLERLLREDRVEQAYLFWLASLPADRLSRLGFLYNGDFAYPLDDTPFDWRLRSGGGVSTALAGDAGNRALKVEFYGARVNFPPVQHLLTLPPGGYVLSGEESSESVETERGLRWRVFCRNDPSAALGTTEPLKGAVAARPFRAAFVIPPDGCPAQTLVLEISARIASETQISGTAVYRRLGVEPTGSVTK